MNRSALMDNYRRVLRPKEAARYLGVSPSNLAKRRVYGQPPAFVRLGRAVGYDIAELDRWLASCRRHSTSDPGADDEHAA
jgi:predicted DNA-binding transcriptional regulator AlpA